MNSLIFSLDNEKANNGNERIVYISWIIAAIDLMFIYWAIEDKSSSELSFMLGALVNATKEAGKVGCMLMRLLTNITILIKNNVILLFISSIFVNCTINTIWRYTHYCKQLRKYLF